jgi:hypothetical protein
VNQHCGLRGTNTDSDRNDAGEDIYLKRSEPRPPGYVQKYKSVNVWLLLFCALLLLRQHKAEES